MSTVLDVREDVFDARLFLTEAVPGFVRPGRRFEPTAERALDGPMRELAATLPGARSGVYVLPEFAGTAGVADLVAVTRAADDIAARNTLDVPPLASLAMSTVVAAIQCGRTTTATHLAHVLQMSDRQVLTYIGRLLALGAIRRSGNGYVRDPRLRPAGRLYALEAKVSDWTSGMNQAVRYAGWADAAAVVVLHPPRRTDEMVSSAKRLRVGLAVGQKWLVRPVLSTHASPTQKGARLLASERFVSSLNRDEQLAGHRPSAAA